MAHRVEYVWLICPKRCPLGRELPLPGPVPVDCPYHPGTPMQIVEVQPARG